MAVEGLYIKMHVQTLAVPPPPGRAALPPQRMRFTLAVGDNPASSRSGDSMFDESTACHVWNSAVKVLLPSDRSGNRAQAPAAPPRLRLSFFDADSDQSVGGAFLDTTQVIFNIE